MKRKTKATKYRDTRTQHTTKGRPSSLGRWIKRARTARGMTQQRLADRVKCDRSTIAQIENGWTRSMRDKVRARVVGVLGR